jgi:hypothetical protein
MFRIISQQDDQPNALTPVIKPISAGGTGGDEVTDAISMLNSIGENTVGQIGSVVPLNSNNKVPVQYIESEVIKAGDCIEGTFITYTRQNINFVITNYDVQRTYVLTAPNAAIALVTYESPIDNLDPGTLVYTAPTVAGNYAFTVNGVTYSVTVLASRIDKPVITSPTNNSTITTSQVTAIASAFTCVGYQETQTESLWELATDSGFTNIVLTDTVIVADAVPFNEFLITFPSNTTFYLRVRYTAAILGNSLWSDTVILTAEVITWPTTEVAILHSDDATPQEWFGTRVAMSQSGDRVIVGSVYDDLGAINATGAAYIFKKTGSAWSQEAKLVSTDTATIKEFGNSVDISADGSIAVVGCWDENINYADYGAVYIFRRSNTSWSLDTKLISPSSASGHPFGNVVDVSQDGNYIAVSSVGYHGGGDNFQGRVYIYHYNGSGWDETILPTQDNVSIFGTALAFDATGTRLIISSMCDYSGSVEHVPFAIYVRNVNTWSLEADLRVTESTGSDWSMSSVDISAAGDRIVIGAQSSNAPLTDAGCVYIFKRTGTTWAQEARLNAPTPVAYSKFGSSVALNDAGDILLVGQPYTTYQGSVYPGLNISEAGIAYVFVRTGTTWEFKKLLSVAFPTPQSWLGISCDLDGSGQYAVIGAMKGSTTLDENHEGTAYIFV